eukprot:SAG11_NODE_2185_length_3711_cov_1.448228_1_plen_303_part_00
MGLRLKLSPYAGPAVCAWGRLRFTIAYAQHTVCTFVGTEPWRRRPFKPRGPTPLEALDPLQAPQAVRQAEQCLPPQAANASQHSLSAAQESQPTLSSRRTPDLGSGPVRAGPMPLVPNVWPLGNIYNIWMLDPKAAPEATSQGAWYFELFVRYLRLSTYVLLTLFQYTYLFPEDLTICRDFTLDWVGMVYVRNLGIGWMLYGRWHWILYVSPLKANLKGKKFNEADQYREGTKNLSREVFYATQGLAIGATFEVLMMHLWGTGRVPYATDFWATPLSSVGWVLFVGYWREFHFFWIHRWMHF